MSISQEDKAITDIINSVWKKYDNDNTGNLDKEEWKKFVQDTLGNWDSIEDFKEKDFD